MSHDFDKILKEYENKLKHSFEVKSELGNLIKSIKSMLPAHKEHTVKF